MADERPRMFTPEMEQWLREKFPDYDPYKPGTPESQTAADRAGAGTEAPGDAGTGDAGDAGSGDAGASR